MSRSFRTIGGVTLAGTMLLSVGALGAERPKEATGLCKDGSFYTGTDQVNACKSNGGLQEWWGKVIPPKDVPNKDAVTNEAKSKDAPANDKR